MVVCADGVVGSADLYRRARAFLLVDPSVRVRDISPYAHCRPRVRVQVSRLQGFADGS